MSEGQNTVSHAHSAPQTPRAAFFDVDNTLMKGSSLFLLSRGMYRRGFFNRRDIASFLFANARYQLTGKESAEEIQRVQNAACEFIKGHDVAEIKSLGIEVYDRYVSQRLWKGTIDMANRHMAQGVEVWLVTATPIELATLIAERLGFTGGIGTIAETENGKYTGKLQGKLCHGKEKARVIRELAAQHNFDLDQSFAYSDSHHDIPLLEAVGNPRAINPDALLYAKAAIEHWPIHDFRRRNLLQKVSTPIIGSLASLTSALNPRLRKKQ